MYYNKHILALSDVFKAQGTKLNVVGGGALHGVMNVSDEEEVAKRIAAKVASEVVTFRKDIIPTIKTIVGKVEKLTESKKRELVVHAPDIVNYFTPVWFNELLNNGTIEEYMPQGYLPGKVVSIPKPKMFTNFLNIDSYTSNLKDFIARIPTSTFERVWDMYMTDLTKNNERFLELFLRNKITKETQFDIYIVLLFLLSLDDELPKGTIGTLGDVRSNIKSARQSIITHIVKETAYLQESKSVVIHSVPETNTVLVNSTLYKDFLEKSSIDVIYGAFYSGVSGLSTERLINESPRFMEEWERAHKKIMVDIKLSADIIYKSAYISVIDDILENKALPEKQDLTPILRDIINGKTVEELSESFAIVEELYTDVLYKGTNLKFFLRELRNYGKGTDIETAVTYAMASMVATFINANIIKHV